jgi:ferritin
MKIMKMSSALAKALNEQISMEANAANAYLAAGSWCEITGYDGSAAFFYAQAEEEHLHMLKFVNFLNGQGVGAIIPAVKQPPKTFKSLEAICKTALTNEQGVTKSINKMVDIAQRDKDHNTFTFLQFFVNEQIEEEQQFENILQKFNLLGRDKLAIYEIDKLLSEMANSTTTESQN